MILGRYFIKATSGMHLSFYILYFYFTLIIDMKISISFLFLVFFSTRHFKQEKVLNLPVWLIID